MLATYFDTGSRHIQHTKIGGSVVYGLVEDKARNAGIFPGGLEPDHDGDFFTVFVGDTMCKRIETEMKACADSGTASRYYRVCEPRRRGGARAGSVFGPSTRPHTRPCAGTPAAHAKPPRSQGGRSALLGAHRQRGQRLESRTLCGFGLGAHQLRHRLPRSRGQGCHPPGSQGKVVHQLGARGVGWSGW